jgi:hypothetical protein
MMQMQNEAIGCNNLATSSGNVAGSRTGANISMSSFGVDGIQLVCNGQIMGTVGALKQATLLPTPTSSSGGSAATPMPTSSSVASAAPLTCMDVKTMYKTQRCCDKTAAQQASQIFQWSTMSTPRRLSDAKDELKSALDTVQAEHGKESARRLAAELIKIMETFTIK